MLKESELRILVALIAARKWLSTDDLVRTTDVSKRNVRRGLNSLSRYVDRLEAKKGPTIVAVYKLNARAQTFADMLRSEAAE